MGGGFSKAMDESFRKNKELTLKSQELMVKRQVAMQNIISEKVSAAQFARGRELIIWTGPPCLIALGYLAYLRRKSNPIVDFSFIVVAGLFGYNVDWALGLKHEEFKKNADALLKNYPETVALPKGPVTVEEIERRRLKEANRT